MEPEQNRLSKKKLLLGFVIIIILVIAIIAYLYRTPPIIATWIWNTQLIVTEREEIIAFAKQHDVNLIYLHIDQENVAHQDYHSFIKAANASGIRVDALAGDPVWSLVSNRKSITTFLNWVQTYNKSAGEGERFSGLHLDIEPHVLPEWNENKEVIKNEWVANIEYLSTEIKKDPALELSVDIPFWMYELSLADKSETVSKWLVSTLDHVTLMAYRDRVEGPNGVLEIVNPIMNEADDQKNKVVVGLNLLQSAEGENTTFYEEGHGGLEEQLAVLEDNLGEFAGYAGYAIHDYEKWRELVKKSEAQMEASKASKPMPVFESEGKKLVAKVDGGDIVLYNGQGWKPVFWAGINLGATTPGHYPGELSPTREDYLRWFSQMKEMNNKVIRIYTILPPIFYEALHEFNHKQEEPLLLLQGIWSPDEALAGEDRKGRDAFTPEITKDFRHEIKDAVQAIHGDVTLPERYGRASGEYRTDVSQYLVGWILGTEWYPYTVQVTNASHPDMPPYQGKYIKTTEKASPFESWLAFMLDYLAEEEMKYGWQHPVSFTNWLTTDPLSHPNEPLPQEDMVSIDPMNLKASVEWTAGYFASYHVYPYYPDFLRYEEKYQKYRDSSGKLDPYAGYLRDLRAHHKGIPLLVAEYGVPSSRGMAHYGPAGRNQGMHTEQEQGEMNADMLRNIYEEGYDGALLFAWQDEWFKFTWNTIDLELPWERRAMWSNTLTNEEKFGVIAVEPGSYASDQIVLDGKTADWEKRLQRVKRAYPGFDLSVTHDEAYLFLMLKKSEGEWDFSKDTLDIGFDTLSGGSRTADKAPGITFSQEIEFLLRMQGESNSRIFVNSAYDQHSWLYGYLKGMLPWDERYDQADSGIFLPWKLALNKALYLPETKKTVPFEELEVGIMKPGISDPQDPAYNSLADWYAKGNVLEIRIPWMLLGYTDPSSKQVWKYPYEAKGTVPTESKGVGVEVFAHSHQKPFSREASKPLLYQWDKWDLPTYHERKKQSFEILRKAYEAYGTPKSE
ncbi:hypothetical protein ACFVS2_00190 [Brevibacillus sp. NPDC058079]|uniref:hypothetical protein n=1 Tax=Brevibacillus sp. NPDC058079 TaxID=3346330 RepID=UPI0036E76254